MRKLSAVLTVVALTSLAAVGLSACGSSGRQGGRHASRAPTPSFPDYLDPQLSYTAEGWTAMYNTYIPLLTYAHASGSAGSKVVPGLANGPAEDHQRRQDLHAAAPQGPQVLRRDPGQGLRLQVRRSNGYSSSTPAASPFYTDIVGAEQFQKTKTGGISGIKTDDKTGKIVIDLTQPRGTFTNELATPVRRAGAVRHAGQRPVAQPAARHRALRDHQVRSRPRLVLRPQPAVGEDQRES